MVPLIKLRTLDLTIPQPAHGRCLHSTADAKVLCSILCARSGSMFLVSAGALYFGTRETYLVAMAAIIWREAYDCVELMRYKKDAYKVVLRMWVSPLGPMPPLLSFNLLNALALWAIMTAD
jgi:hypothetical protein